MHQDRQDSAHSVSAALRRLAELRAGMVAQMVEPAPPLESTPWARRQRHTANIARLLGAVALAVALWTCGSHHTPPTADASFAGEHRS